MLSEVVTKPVNKIIIKSLPSKVNYIQNHENLDLTGGVLKIIYNDESIENISMTDEDVEVIGFDNTKAGKNTLTVKYGGKTATFDVTIEAKKLIQIEVTQEPTKTEYLEGENFDQSGMKVVAKYNDTTSKEITDYIVADGNNMPVGKTSVTISYTEDNITKTIELPIRVLEKLRVEFIDYIEINRNEKNYITNIEPATTLEEFITKIKTNGNIQILKDETEITNNETIITTGMKVKISLNDEMVEYITAVKGDANGDGQCDLRDILQVNKHRLNKAQLENEFLLAGDVNNDIEVNLRDILQMNKFRLGKINSL